MSEKEFEKICSLLAENGVGFKAIEHAPVRTSAEAAQARGQPLGRGVKALVVKFRRAGKEFFSVIDLPADRKLDWKKTKQVLRADEVRFATEPEVVAQTGCEPGGVAPLGHAQPLPILADPKIFEEETVEFNAGLKTKSIRLASLGLKKVFDAIGVAYFDLVS